jgi:serine/threonine protein kinase
MLRHRIDVGRHDPLVPNSRKEPVTIEAISGFEKRYANRTLFDEALAASEEAAAIAQRARYLRVPAVLASDPDGLWIRFEYMEGWSILRRLLRSGRFLGLPDGTLDGIMRNTGRALAEYHDGSGKIHDDFDPTNVLFRVGEPRICLIDFSRPDFDDHPDYCRASIYRDLAQFIIHLCVKYPPQQLFLAYRPKNRILARAFLEGYFEISSRQYCFDELQTEFAKCLEIPYLARSFMNRFLRGTDRFDLEYLR